MLGEGIPEEDPDAVPEQDGIRHLHHGRLEVEAEHDLAVGRVLDLPLVVRHELRRAHGGGVDDLPGLEGVGPLEDGGGASVLHELDDHVGIGIADGSAQLRGEEVPPVHVSDVGAAGLGPDAHLVRVLGRVGLDGRSDAAVRVALPKDWIDGRPEHGRVAGLDVPLFGILRIVRVGGNVVALGAELLDAGLELGDGGGDVGKLDHVTSKQICMA